jgi:hypothetical protein
LNAAEIDFGTVTITAGADADRARDADAKDEMAT